QLVLNAQGRLETEQQFGDIILKVGQDGRLVYLRDVVRTPKLDASGKPIPGEKGIELGAQNSDLICTLSKNENGKPIHHPSVALAVFALPTANALATGDGVKQKMEE